MSVRSSTLNGSQRHWFVRTLADIAVYGRTILELAEVRLQTSWTFQKHGAALILVYLDEERALAQLAVVFVSIKHLEWFSLVTLSIVLTALVSAHFWRAISKVASGESQREVFRPTRIDAMLSPLARFACPLRFAAPMGQTNVVTREWMAPFAMGLIRLRMATLRHAVLEIHA